MNSKDFIINKLRKLIKKFPALKASYSFQELSDTHSLAILSKDCYYGNQLFKQHEEDLIVDFVTKYPVESLCFLTEDSIIPIDNIELALTGDTYKDLNSSYCTILEYEGELFDNSYYEAFDDIFRDFKPEISGSFILEQEIKGIYSLPSLFSQNHLVTVLDKETDREDNPSDYFTPDTDYSLAA